MTLSVTGLPVYSLRDALDIISVNPLCNRIELRNSTANTNISTKGMFLSNNNNLFQLKIPAMIVRAGDTISINGGKKRMYGLFNLAPGETLRLTDADGMILALFEFR
jgi:hypothetical protein